MTVTTRDGLIVITGAAGHRAVIAAADGRVVAACECGPTTAIPVTPGVYLVTVATRTTKVLVR